MAVKINNISIDAFRGIHTLEIPLAGKSLLILGENGTGKSSITEAIEFFFTTKISHLEGTQGFSTESHGPHIHYTPDRTKVRITFNIDGTSLEKTFDNEISPPPKLEEYFETTKKGTFILHRSQILTFICSRPADRFYALASIMGVENLDNVELEMMRTRESLKGEQEVLEQEYKGFIAELSTMLEANIKKQDEIIPHLNQKLKLELLPEIASINDVDKHTEAMLKQIKTTQQYEDKIARLNELIALTNHSLIPQNIGIDFNDFILKVNEFLDQNTDISASLSLERFLNQGKDIIQSQKNNICPLCEQPIEIENLNAKIEMRLQTFRNLSSNASDIRKAGEILKTRIKHIEDELSVFLLKLSKVNELSDYKSQFEKGKQFLTNAIASIDIANSLNQKVTPDNFVEYFSEIESCCVKIQGDLKKLIESTELTEKEKETLKLIRLLEQVKNISNSITKNQIKLDKTRFHYSLAEKIYKTFTSTKNSKVQQIYDSIQCEIAKYYSILHPNEPHGKIELVVALGKRASTNLRMESFGRPGEDPRALASEGHLDSLGLCIFLGFVKNFNKNCSLIILDDVVTTVDSSHREKICKLLFEEFSDKQFVITTHDGIWYEQLCAHQRSYNLSNNFSNLEIIKWDIGTGPIFRNHKTRWEKITEKIDEVDKTGAANLSRQYLEYLLLNIAERFEVPVKVKTSLKYDVGDLFGPIESRFNKLLKEGQMKTVTGTALQNLKQTTIMGNLLSHYNPITENISLTEVKSFANAVNNLEKVLQCTNCSRDLFYLQKIKAIRCSNTKCSNPQEIPTN